MWGDNPVGLVLKEEEERESSISLHLHAPRKGNVEVIARRQEESSHQKLNQLAP